MYSISPFRSRDISAPALSRSLMSTPRDQHCACNDTKHDVEFVSIESALLARMIAMQFADLRNDTSSDGRVSETCNVKSGVQRPVKKFFWKTSDFPTLDRSIDPNSHESEHRDSLRQRLECAEDRIATGSLARFQKRSNANSSPTPLIVMRRDIAGGSSSALDDCRDSEKRF